MVGDAVQVSVGSRTMVVPAQPTHTDTCFLSCLDLYWKGLRYNQRLIFYDSTITEERLPGVSGQDGTDGPAAREEGSDGRAAAAVMEKLKSSLSLSLVHYYPWCGRIAQGAHPPHRLFIDCSDAGVEFVEASVDLPLSLLAHHGLQMNPFFQKLCQLPDHKGDCLFSSPLLSIQATLFSDGGLALGIASSHIVADGQSLWNFMVSWGECARGVPLSAPPLLNRERLAVLDPSLDKATWRLKLQIKEEDKEEEEMYSDKGDSTTQKDDKHQTCSAGTGPSSNMNKDSTVGMDPTTNEDKDNPSMKEDKYSGMGSNPITNRDSDSSVQAKNEETSRSVELDRYKDSMAGTNASVGGDKKAEPLVQCMFHLPASVIMKLKSEAGDGRTSFQVICAHFWKRVAVARGYSTREPTYFFVPVNCRNRMTPPLPSTYFGNVIAFDVILSTVGAIQRETLCATACRIQDTVAKITDNFLLGFMHWLETHNYSLEGAYSSSTPRGKGHNVASSPWFPAYQVDFGWGKPVAVRPVNVHGDGQLVMFGGLPGSMQGDVEICIALHDSVLRRLLKDPEFLAKPPCSPFADE